MKTATLLTDLLSPKKIIYGKKGDRVTIKSIMGEVAIVLKNNNAFPIHQSKIKETE